MSNQNRQTLKQYFQTGNTPTQDQFADLIDSGLNQVDDSITCDTHGQIGIGNPTPNANLNVRGRLFASVSGTISVANGATTATGTGTSFDTELAAGDAIQVGAQRFTVATVTDATHLELATAATTALTDVKVFRDANLLLIENGNGDAQVVIDKSGNVGIGTATPTAKLQVAGKVIATALVGEGSGITNMSAANLEGNLKLEQLPALTAKEIPDLPASKITTGQLKADRLPALTAELIPDLPASKITSGQLNLAQLPALTAEQIPNLPASKITGLPTLPDSAWVGELQHAISIQNGQIAIGPVPPSSELVISTDVPSELGPVLTLVNGSGGAGAGAAIDFDGWDVPPQLPSTARIQSVDDGKWSSHLTLQTKQPGAPENQLIERLRIDSAGNVGIGTATPQSKLEIAAQDGLRISGFQPFITLEDTSRGNKSGYLQSTGGNLNFIPNSFHAQNSAAMVIEDETGTVNVSGTVRASQFEGSGAGLTNIPAANITGKLSSAQLPSESGTTEVSANNISGVLSPTQIPSLDKITGVLHPDQVPSLDKITGVLTLNQIPQIPSSKLTAAAPTQAVGPGGRPLLASGSVSPGSTQNIFAIPMSTDFEAAGFYSFEIYTTNVSVGNSPGTAGPERIHVMTRTVLAGVISFSSNPDNLFQSEPLITGPTQTNHPESTAPAVSFAIVNDESGEWLQMQTTAGSTNWPEGQPPPVNYYVYSLM